MDVHTWLRQSFLHPRRVNGLAVFCLIAAETVGEGDACGGVAGVFRAHVLASPMVFGGDHHRAENVVAIEGEDGIAAKEGIAETEVEIAGGGEVHWTLVCLCACKTIKR